MKKLIFFLFLVESHAYADNQPTLLPLACDRSLKEKVLPFIAEAEAKAPKNLNSRLKKMAFRSFDHGGKYALYVRDHFFNRDSENQQIISFYEDHGFKSRDSMIRDIVEGVWVHKSENRCAAIQRAFNKSNNAKNIEDITDQPNPVQIDDSKK